MEWCENAGRSFAARWRFRCGPSWFAVRVTFGRQVAAPSGCGSGCIGQPTLWTTRSFRMSSIWWSAVGSTHSACCRGRSRRRMRRRCSGSTTWSRWGGKSLATCAASTCPRSCSRCCGTRGRGDGERADSQPRCLVPSDREHRPPGGSDMAHGPGQGGTHQPGRARWVVGHCGRRTQHEALRAAMREVAEQVGHGKTSLYLALTVDARHGDARTHRRDHGDPASCSSRLCDRQGCKADLTARLRVDGPTGSAHGFTEAELLALVRSETALHGNGQIDGLDPTRVPTPIVMILAEKSDMSLWVEKSGARAVQSKSSWQSEMARRIAAEADNARAAAPMA